jgi:hypothetical protein
VVELWLSNLRCGLAGGTLLVAPLAAISLLAAAAAVALNPVLVSVSLTGKKRRKRRSLFGLENNFDTNDSVGESSSRKLSFDGQDVMSSITPEVQEKIDEMQVLEKFLGSVPSDIKYQQQILSMYLSCSGYTDASNTRRGFVADILYQMERYQGIFLEPAFRRFSLAPQE